MFQNYTRNNKEDYRQKRKEAYKLIRRKKRLQNKQEISNLENLRNRNSQEKPFSTNPYNP